MRSEYWEIADFFILTSKSVFVLQKSSMTSVADFISGSEFAVISTSSMKSWCEVCWMFLSAY